MEPVGRLRSSTWFAGDD